VGYHCDGAKRTVTTIKSIETHIWLFAMSSAKSDFLNSAMQKEALVGFRRRFEDNYVHGYVLALGAEFFVLASVSDRIRYDGYECFRIADIKKPDFAKNTAFIEAALTARGEVRPSCKLDVTSLETLLISASAAFPLITIHQEKRDSDVCWIGRILGVQRHNVSLLEIRPDATWCDEPSQYELKDITRVNFDGDYERALHLVGGNPT
jgi:hypothetical protein